MRPICERCQASLPAAEAGAFICSYECTFCAECAASMSNTCPNCGGVLLPRPTRA